MKANRNLSPGAWVRVILHPGLLLQDLLRTSSIAVFLSIAFTPLFDFHDTKRVFKRSCRRYPGLLFSQLCCPQL